MPNTSPPPLKALQDYSGPRWWAASRLFQRPRTVGIKRVGLVALTVSVAAVATGLMNVLLGWNGIRVPAGPLVIDLTIYPPLLLSVLAALWIGPTWGFVPAYLANLTSAIAGGVPLGSGLIFAFAGVLETAILWGAMVVLNISPDLRRWRDLGRFLALGFIAATISSLGVLIWNTSLGLDFVSGQRMWRGWVVGDFLLLALVAAPLLHWAGPAARSWIDRQFAEPPRQEATFMHSVIFAWLLFAVLGVLVIVGTQMLQGSLDIAPDARTRSGELLLPRLREIEMFLGLLVASLILTTGAFSTALAQIGERERADARRESLTGCYNRRAYYELFRRELDRCRRLGQPLSLAFVDVDHFKTINDRYGHEAGDELLRQLAARFREAIRETDLLFRWGGEEFVILLSHTGPTEARTMAERIRSAVGRTPFRIRGAAPATRATVSIGIAGSLDHVDSADELVARADAACYRAKSQGRDRVEVAETAA